MRGHWAYLKYTMRHKWFVFLECCKLGIPWLGIIHDWSKLFPSEWIPYVHSFYKSDGTLRRHRDETGYYDPAKIGREFDFAWLHHQHWNKHHWQHWMLVQDFEDDKVLEMPEKYLREMLADWRGAGRAKMGEDNSLVYYARNVSKIQLRPEARAWIERKIGWSVT